MIVITIFDEETSSAKLEFKQRDVAGRGYEILRCIPIRKDEAHEIMTWVREKEAAADRLIKAQRLAEAEVLVQQLRAELDR